MAGSVRLMYGRPLDVRKLSSATIDVLGIARGKRDAMNEGVTELVGNRLRRAQSV